MALRYDPADFTLRGEIASLLHEMGEHREAFQHVQCIPGDFRLPKYWKIGGTYIYFGHMLLNSVNLRAAICPFPSIDYEYLSTISNHVMMIHFYVIVYKKMFPLTNSLYLWCYFFSLSV